MGLENFNTTGSTTKSSSSPHSDLDEETHMVNFMLSVEVEPGEPEESVVTARDAVMKLKKGADGIEQSIEVVGPAEVVDEQLRTVKEIEDENIGVIWRHDSDHQG